MPTEGCLFLCNFFQKNPVKSLKFRRVSPKEVVLKKGNQTVNYSKCHICLFLPQFLEGFFQFKDSDTYNNTLHNQQIFKFKILTQKVMFFCPFAVKFGIQLIIFAFYLYPLCVEISCAVVMFLLEFIIAFLFVHLSYC